ncbi:hypothetical protein C4546_04595 [Candidatus Parcubacteria bacterium]|nr:MAG: hypothetical protein C4546_04595 [Candidatus Parcubacteria bacterium]
MDEVHLISVILILSAFLPTIFFFVKWRQAKAYLEKRSTALPDYILPTDSGDINKFKAPIKKFQRLSFVFGIASLVLVVLRALFDVYVNLNS